jgi:hypothetical protein
VSEDLRFILGFAIGSVIIWPLILYTYMFGEFVSDIVKDLWSRK